MGKTIVVYGSSTGTCEAIAEKIAEKVGAKAMLPTLMMLFWQKTIIC